MKKAIVFLVIAGALFVGVVALRFVRPPNLSSSDPEVSRLESEQRELLGYAASSRDKEAEAERVRASLWSAASLDQLVKELPKGWTAQRLSSETKAGITLCRYAFSKDAAQLRDYTEFLRVLKKLEERPATRLEAVNLVLNQDGQKFAAALITATLPLPSTPAQK